MFLFREPVYIYMVATATKKTGTKRKRALSDHEKWWNKQEKQMYDLYVLGNNAKLKNHKLTKAEREKRKILRKNTFPTVPSRKRKAQLLAVGHPHSPYFHPLRKTGVTGEKPAVSDADVRWLVRIKALKKTKAGKETKWTVSPKTGLSGQQTLRIYKDREERKKKQSAWKRSR